MTLNEKSLEKRFNEVSTSQGSIQSLSFFCLHYKNHHKKIAQVWLRCLQKAKVLHRLTLIYLANDIVQNAKRKNALTFIDDFKNILKDTVPYLRDDKIKKSVERVFSIWQDRSIFDAKFTNELKNSLNGASRGPATESAKMAPIQAELNLKHTTNDLRQTLDRLENIERDVEKLRSSDDNIIDLIAQNSFPSGDGNNNKHMTDLRNYIMQLKTEIDERNKLSKLLEESLIDHKRLLKESEDQLALYKSKLDYITKLREDLRSSH